ncbi:MAG: cation transporter, partial [Brevundimonas sp.]
MAVIAVNGAAFMAIASGASLQGSAPPGRQCARLPGRRATYGISLAVIGRSVAVQSGAANGQGASLVALVLLFLS